LSSISTAFFVGRICYAFYQDVLGLDMIMAHGWITTYGSQEKIVQISFASEGGGEAGSSLQRP
jgi:hypothetical protein